MLRKIAVIGAGNMGSALVRGWIRSGLIGPEALVAFDIDGEKTLALKRELGTSSAASALDAIVPETDVMVLAVKPQDMGEVLDEVSERIQDNPLVVSIAAGISTEFILSHLHPMARVIRAMPNAGAMVGQSATALCKAGGADAGDLQKALELFNVLGKAVAVEEKMMNAVTALSGSGPGYLFVIMEALTDGGVRMGLSRATARELTIQTVLGAAVIASQQTVAFSELKDRITSPGGTTIAGLQVIERAGVRGTLIDAVEAATRRGEELQARG
jgi:pyrroline-5-carboxylate reductase